MAIIYSEPLNIISIYGDEGVLCSHLSATFVSHIRISEFKIIKTSFNVIKTQWARLR